jgi:hypothetical protein
MAEVHCALKPVTPASNALRAFHEPDVFNVRRALLRSGHFHHPTRRFGCECSGKYCCEEKPA